MLTLSYICIPTDLARHRGMIARRRSIWSPVPHLMELVSLRHLLHHVNVVIQTLVETHPNVLQVPGDVNLAVRIIKHRVSRHILNNIVFLSDLFLLPKKPLFLLFQPPGSKFLLKYFF